MKRLFCFKIIAAAFSLILITSCSSSSVYNKVYPTLNDGKYDSEFPYRNSSAQLENISNSVKLVNSIAFYTSYLFNESDKIRAVGISGLNFEKVAYEKVFFNRTASGTATLINKDQGQVALLTVAHVVSFPDTIISFFVNQDGSLSNYVQSISIKSKQTNYVTDLPDNGEIEILAIDKVNDLAILGRSYKVEQTLKLVPFAYPWGKSSDLEWGSFVYVFGYPMNFKMVTKGIVSSPAKEKNYFLIDAAYNRGFSGGIVLAIRDGVPNFELVGLVKSVPADFMYTVRPMQREHDLDYNPMIPYKGEVYVDKEQVLRPGITKVIDIEVVKEFIENSKQELISKGYYLKDFFSAPSQLKLKEVH
ncbi:MAG: serine protease [Bacteroidetes bacterium]|nr:serine protease [Bacteroidota bacterium]